MNRTKMNTNKKVYLLALLSFVTLTVTADVKIDETTFPDDIFRSWVLHQEYGKDGRLTEDEIAKVTFLNLFPQNIIAKGYIKSLKGIEYFTAVTKLVCSRNELTELDLSKNTALTWLDCNGNHLSKLDLSKNTELTNLDCNANELTALDVSCCNKLTELYCYINKLTTLNVSGCSALTILKCYVNQLKVIDVSGCTSLATMWAFNNQLSALNVLDCTSLSVLWCYDNQLTQLDVSKNRNLTDLRCGENQLTLLDVSKNAMLTELRCEKNQLTALDFSKNKKLTSLWTYHNPIEEESMDALIESLPTASRGGWCVVFNEDEDGVVTTTQLATAKAKGWKSYYWNDTAKSWMDYTGNQYESLANSNFLWTMRYEIVSPSGGVNYEEIKLDGDTLVRPYDSLLYKNLWKREWREGETKPEAWQKTKGWALGQYGGKVYLTGLGLIMDFSAQVGDVVKINELDADGTMALSYKVEAISDTVFASSTDKKRRRCLHVRNVHYQLGTDIWVEGIGSLTYGVGGDRTYYGGAWPQLMECRRGDEILYRHEDFVTSVNSVRTSVNPASGIYDLQGRRLTQKPAKGVYIQDGKKVVVK